ncbi:hypothetical protein VOLCADRAFT_89158 [Volvox carteri f. nagariensis]|uniref:Uncharacterized protein n=1 Tax=Volvox carteri f. nagariensis TaxID=3068 RepID=D8TQY4_VOLCA|nr:uncharacterized protein VOLCADRAFT_89158 [Volvox carteri f. nagariensis]EFJ50107.1 hypothetical protein VOLCADRAFT_89158 [Volvox carteri f. nagariensis]|eukprot:XP_002948727.1 hypothetical protein VOLCADRAFT_89158 [Volvox carteri f. nagariensis]
MPTMLTAAYVSRLMEHTLLLEASFKATGMVTNIAKCEVLIFEGTAHERKRLMEADVHPHPGEKPNSCTDNSYIRGEQGDIPDQEAPLPLAARLSTSSPAIHKGYVL